MRLQKQLFRHNPELGEFGDCHRTCIACLLDVDAREVPNFGVYYEPEVADLFQPAVNEYLSGIGLMEVMTPFTGSLEAVLECRRLQAPGVPFILAGTSGNDTGHSTIALDGKIIWDPSQDESGLVGPMKDGFYWVSYLVPLTLSGWICNLNGHVPIWQTENKAYCEICDKEIHA